MPEFREGLDARSSRAGLDARSSEQGLMPEA